MLPQAFVTLLTDISYLPGALVLLYALQDQHPSPRDFQIVCLVTPQTVDAAAIGVLQNAGFDLVIGVEPIASGKAGRRNLDLMGRSDLNLALTKLHIFRLGSLFSKIIYLDADTLPIKPLAHLFEAANTHTLSACPDIGWPDCFNSGVLVIKPKEADFDRLQQCLRRDDSNSSFDGADQGLLNQYFSERGGGDPWHRLPFTYNVTPSAAYQYAPAYRHYAHDISVLHFIGSNKPWRQLPNRPAGKSHIASRTYDYESLVSHWFEVYDRHVRPMAAQEPDVAKRFAVPEYTAAWNQPEAPAPGNTRMSLEELKQTILTGVASTKQDRYMSMPLEGRVDLMMPSGTPPQVEEGGKDDPQYISTEDRAAADDDANQSSHGVDDPPTNLTGHGGHQTERRHSQESAWDAAHHPPPRNGLPEMMVPMTTIYAPAWDEPSSASAKYFEHVSESKVDYPTLPHNVKTNDWYGKFTQTKPDPEQVSTVFPWEARGGNRPAATRRFPKQAPVEVESKLDSISGDTSSDLTSGPHKLGKAEGCARGNTSSHIPQQPKANSWTDEAARRPTLDFAESMALYTNAWDDIASINSYARRLTAIGVGVERRTQASGLETVAATPLGHSSPTVPSCQSSPLVSPSTGSADGDDEEDRNNGHCGRHCRRRATPSYKDREAQTERLGVDAIVQTVPGSGIGASAGRRLDLLTHPAADTYPFSGSGGGTSTTRTRQQPSRTWDPTTDIDLRRQDSEEVLHRFMQTNMNFYKGA